MKLYRFFAAAAVMAAVSFTADAQLKSLGQSLKNAANKAQSAVNKTKTDAGSRVAPSAKSDKRASADVNKGPIYYVCQETGSNRADGLSPETAKKDIQKVLDIIRDNGQNGAVVRVAAGNYLGYLDAGYIEISNWITLEGGWSDDFTSRDPFKNITRIQPGKEQIGTNGSKALITVSKLDDSSCAILGTLVIDGNKNLKADDPLLSYLWQPYLNGFANLKVLDSSSSFDANSPTNLYRQAHGMNMQGSEIIRVSMYGNRYRFDEAMKLFGAKEGYGAQK